MVGGYALRYALNHPSIKRVTAIGRRKIGISDPKLNEVVHQDFADCSTLADELSGQNAAVFCLGAYTGAVSDKVLRTISAQDFKFDPCGLRIRRFRHDRKFPRAVLKAVHEFPP
jgi:hypothetical protein